MPAHAAARGRWLDALLAERQVYVRGRGRPYFVTVTRRARTLRLLALFCLLLTTVGLGTALTLGYQRYAALRDELARARPVEDAGRSRERALADLDAARRELQSARDERDRLAAEAQKLRAELDSVRAAAVPAGTVIPVAATASPEAADAAIAASKGGQDLQAALDAALARAQALDAELAQARHRNEELALILARRAPSPPALAPR
jgi:cell division protein FtsB